MSWTSAEKELLEQLRGLLSDPDAAGRDAEQWIRDVDAQLIAHMHRGEPAEYLLGADVSASGGEETVAAPAAYVAEVATAEIAWLELSFWDQDLDGHTDELASLDAMRARLARYLPEP